MENKELIKQFTKIKEVNQRLKYMSSLYLIEGNIIGMQSLISFIEKIIILNEDIDISAYDKSIVLPNKFYDFYSKTKKKDLSISARNEKDIQGIEFKNTDDDTIFMMNTVNNLNNDIVGFYKIPEIFKTIDKLSFTPLSESDNEDLMKRAVYINHKNSQYTITKNIFPSLKKTDKISFVVLDLVDENNLDKVYIMFRKDIVIGFVYTLTAFLQFDITTN